MPNFEYTCPDGHRTGPLLRRISARHDPMTCEKCGKPAELAISLPHCIPDGVYSYAPNLGDPTRYEQKHEAAKAKKLISD